MLPAVAKLQDVKRVKYLMASSVQNGPKTMFFKDYSLLVVFNAYLRSKCTIPDIYVPRFLATCAISKLRCANWRLPICLVSFETAHLLRNFETARRRSLVRVNNVALCLLCVSSCYFGALYIIERELMYCILLFIKEQVH